MTDEQIQKNWETYVELLRSTKREGIEDLIAWIDKSDFKLAPASTKYHNDFRGGLLAHSLNVYYIMYDFINYITYFNIPADSIIIASLLHDICKVYFYKVEMGNSKNEQTGQWEKVPYYTVKDRFPIGHGEKSIIIVQKYIKLTAVEVAMIRNHMGFCRDNEMDVSNLFSMYPESLLLHFADQLATYIPESKDLDNTLKQMFIGRNISESLDLLNKRDNIIIEGTSYKLALPNATVDNKTIIELDYNGQKVKVFSPHGDGLPF